MEEFSCTLETRKALEERYVVQSYLTNMYVQRSKGLEIKVKFKFETIIERTKAASQCV